MPVVIGALINGRLGGYLAGFAVDGTAYLEQVYLSTEALCDYVGISLASKYRVVSIQVRYSLVDRSVD